MFTFFSWLFTNQISQLFVYKILFCLLLYKYTYNLKRILSVCFHILVRMIYIYLIFVSYYHHEFMNFELLHTTIMANKKSNLLYQNVSFIIWNTTMIKSMLYIILHNGQIWRAKKIALLYLTVGCDFTVCIKKIFTHAYSYTNYNT